jgi:pSer/pThr/pTyr-binding forkhead associated (FHA) protein
VNAARLVSLADGAAHCIGALPLTIGRAPSSDVPVHNEDVSRRHAYVLKTPQGFLLVESSLHGTFLNGEPVQAQCILHDGDVVQVGHLSFRFDLRTDDLPATIFHSAHPLPETTEHRRAYYPEMRTTGKLGLALPLDQRTSWKERLGRFLALVCLR